MRFAQPLVEGTLLRRHNRFLAHVRLGNGDEVTAHCAHPGSMTGCSDPGSKVLVSLTKDPRRRFRHQLEIIYAGRTPVAVHTGRPASVVAEAIGQAKIGELLGYAVLKQNVRSGRDMRIDLVLEGNGLRSCYVMVKNVTWAEDHVAYHPDAEATNSIHELTGLTDLIREGCRAMVIFVVPRSDVTTFKLADHVDPDYVQAFRDAVARGVEIASYRAKVTRRGIELDRQIPADLS